MLNERRAVTPQQAVEIFKKNGTEITLEEARLILDFIYKFAKLALNQVFKK